MKRAPNAENYARDEIIERYGNYIYVWIYEIRVKFEAKHSRLPAGESR